MDTITRPAQIHQAIHTVSGNPNDDNSDNDDDGAECPTDYFQCPESLGPRSCCPTGYACNDTGGCVLTLGASIGTTTIISVITVSATQGADSGDKTGGHLTRADIGGVVGGVIGALLLLGVAIWVIMRRLNGMMKYVQARLGPPPDKMPSGEPERLGLDKNHALPQQLPPEVCDPHSEGTVRHPPGELTGSYDAHGISELGGNT